MGMEFQNEVNKGHSKREYVSSWIEKEWSEGHDVNRVVSCNQVFCYYRIGKDKELENTVVGEYNKTALFTSLHSYQ